MEKIIANVLNVKVDVIENEQGPALGGAILAAVGCGEFADVESAIASLVKTIETIEPQSDLVEKI